jgi:hypothetical protein
MFVTMKHDFIAFARAIAEPFDKVWMFIDPPLAAKVGNDQKAAPANSHE